jgi:hypothetical protein
MTTISKSPNRHTFHLNTAKEKGDEEKIKIQEELFELALDWENKKLENPKFKNSMEHDLLSTDWILRKVRESAKYSQNLYAAICNNNFIKNDVWPILKGETWSASWRYTGGIVADMREEGDYIDWYCSGMGGGFLLETNRGINGYVSEGTVTDEIKEDLLKLGWVVVENTDYEY